MGLSWKIGDIEIYQIVELEAGKIIQSVINGATEDKVGKLDALVQCFLVKSSGKNILIDSCNGNGKTRVDIPEWGNLQTNFLERLTELSPSLNDIDIVINTHLHMDHVGWNTKLVGGSWVPTFPKASYLIVKKEYDYWESKPEKEITDDKAAFEDSVDPVVQSGLAEFVEANHKIDKSIRFVATPGHTPGHVSVVIESKGWKALITGDLLYHPIQIENPDWTTQSDTDTNLAVKTRQRVLTETAETNTLIIGSHFPDPVTGYITKSDGKLTFKKSWSLDLNDMPFEAIKSGKKKVETRTKTEGSTHHWWEMKKGDQIVFTKKTAREKMAVEVLGVRHYKDVASMFDGEGQENCMSYDAPRNGAIDSYRELKGYPKGIKKYGIWAIEVKPLVVTDEGFEPPTSSM